MSKQTAVEWLEAKVNEMIQNGGDADLLAVIQHIQQALAMEKEQIIEAHDEGEGKIVGNGLKYYNETYGNT